MPATLKLDIVTPEARVFSGYVEMVTVPGRVGEMGIFPMHVPLMSLLAPGEVVARVDGQDQYFAVGDGFIKIMSDRVAILTDMAVEAKNIDEAAVEEARHRAESRLKETLDNEETATVSAALAHSLAQLHVKHRHPR